MNIKNSILLLSIVFIGLTSCQNSQNKQDDTTSSTAQSQTSTEKWNGYRKIDPREIKDNFIQLVGKEWMLITAGNENSYNTMTASWGGFGEIWNKPVSMITVRDTRYTYEFIEANDIYTLTFFPAKYKDKLSFLGTRSGRDTNKIKDSGLTPISTPLGSMSFSEGRMIIECRKLYGKPMDKDAILDKKIAEEVYGHEASMHTLYIGDIINVWIK